MKKVTTLALVAMLAIAGAAFAGERFAGIEANATFAVGSPTTTNNDDSCDIGVTPAATLLLPYFEVDVNAQAGAGQNTLFAITNTSRLPQIAHVTLWTDWSVPVLDFNIFLTGYDVQTISLYDVIVRGIVAPPNGTSATDATISPLGTAGTIARLSAANTANPNHVLAAVSAGGVCSQLPGTLPTTLVTAVRSALTTGAYTGFCTNTVGGSHAGLAIGYVTVDVANTCSTRLPTDADYMATEILFDNVLVGDYFQVNGAPTTGNYAQGNPMVHIRAIPEGGPAGSNPGTNLPYTFYGRYQAAATPRLDRRQPLPATFAARWIQGGTTGFATDYKMWREGATGATSCGVGAAATGFNSAIPVSSITRFDERENPFGFGGGFICSPCSPGGIPATNEASRVNVNASNFPALTGGDTAGWMYLNLNAPVSGTFTRSGLPAARPSQNWVVVSMFAEGRYSVDFDAAWLGNGCSGVVAAGATIAPAGGTPVCPAGFVCTATNTGTTAVGYTGTNATP